MGIRGSSKVVKLVLPLAIAGLPGSPAWAAADASAPAQPPAVQDEQPAVWTPKQLHFVYQGFTTKYSCDGLQDKIQTALLQLGARKKDLKVTGSGCAVPYGRPDPFAGVDVKMSVLQPASDKTDASRQPTVPAYWKAVDLKLTRSGDYYNPSGECELVEQIKSKILPLFATRGVELKSECIPYQATPTSPTLRLEVLAPAKADKGHGAGGVENPAGGADRGEHGGKHGQ
ncbi:MAG TPA: hypothetical protein VIY54_02900 [Steroidobacteraceae bacterium]